jgi:curved DNA-binding protein
MAFIDDYQILGVDKNASESDIATAVILSQTKAYRKPARQHHPDMNLNDPDFSRPESEMEDFINPVLASIISPQVNIQ